MKKTKASHSFWNILETAMLIRSFLSGAKLVKKLYISKKYIKYYEIFVWIVLFLSNYDVYGV